MRQRLAIGIIVGFMLVSCGTNVGTRVTPEPIINIMPAPTTNLEATKTAFAVQLQPTDQPKGVYFVRDGDTLESIALAFNTTIEEISATNKLEDINVLYIGQPLVIPSLISDTLQLTPQNPSEVLTPTP